MFQELEKAVQEAVRHGFQEGVEQGKEALRLARNPYVKKVTLAKELDIDPRTLAELEAHGLRPAKIGGTWYYDRRDYLEVMELLKV